jgi:PsbP
MPSHNTAFAASLSLHASSPSIRPLLRTRISACTSQPHAAPGQTCASPRISRRALLTRTASASAAATALALTSLPFLPAQADTAAAPEVVETYNYSFTAPANFSKSVVSLSGGRIATIFVSDADHDTNVTMVTTPVASDFQRLTSFGPVETVVNTVVPPNVAGNKLIAVTNDAGNNAYVFDYELKPSGDKDLRRLRTVFSLQPGQNLCTLTAQATADRWDGVKDVLVGVTDSYRLKIQN